MITIPKVKIYAHYDGDLDMWLRTGKKAEKEIMASEDWHLIDGLIEDCTVIQNRVGSERREADTFQRLIENCENEETIKALMKLAKKG